MVACLLVGGKELAIAGAAFMLSWTHSVEKTEWRESWLIGPQGLTLQEARVRGSGAGMDPGEGARLEDGWWVWSPKNPPVDEILLAASGATGNGWRLCHEGGCERIGGEPGPPVAIATCAGVAERR